MNCIVSSLLLATSYTANGAVETHKNGILIYRDGGQTIFPISGDTARSVSHYLGERGDQNIIPFDTLGGMADVPGELAMEWQEESGSVPPICNFTVAQVGEGEGWLLCYSWCLSDEDELVKAVILTADEFKIFTQDCDSYSAYHRFKGVEVGKAWIYKGSLPTSDVTVVSTHVGLDLVFSDKAIFSTSGEAEADWGKFIPYCREMLYERPPYSYRRSIRFEDTGKYDLRRLEDGIEIRFYQFWPHADEIVESPSGSDKRPRYIGTIVMTEEDLQAFERLIGFTDEEEETEVSVEDVLSQLIDGDDDELEGGVR